MVCFKLFRGHRKNAYVVASKVRPGDILLLAGDKFHLSNDKHTSLIKILTFSKYTHAALFITQLAMLETNGPDEHAQLTVGPITRDINGTLLISTGCRCAIILRPKKKYLEEWAQRTGTPEDKFGNAVQGNFLAYLGREYIERYRIAYATHWIFRWIALPVITIAKQIENISVRSIINNIPKSFFERWCCSGLVAQAYEDVGMRLTTCSIKNVSPGRISRSRKLTKVNDAIVYLDDEGVTTCRDMFAIHGGLSESILEPLFRNAAHIYQHNITSRKAVVGFLERKLRRLGAGPLRNYKILRRVERRLKDSGKL
ncbi:hypothetical protein CCP1ISM_100007 [Azospirillaceae bacterium]